ncbi:hypothetical protein D9M68_750880 [compost metagenome]
MRPGVAGEVVEHVGRVHIGTIAQRDEMRKADLPRARPVQHGGGQRAGLGGECQLALPGRAGREAGIEADSRSDQPDAVWPENPEQMGPRRVQHGLPQGASGAVLGTLEAGGQHDGRARAGGAKLRDEPRDGGCGRA